MLPTCLSCQEIGLKTEEQKILFPLLPSFQPRENSSNIFQQQIKRASNGSWSTNFCIVSPTLYHSAFQALQALMTILPTSSKYGNLAWILVYVRY